MIRGASDYRNLADAFKLRGNMIRKLTDRLARAKREIEALREANRRLRDQRQVARR